MMAAFLRFQSVCEDYLRESFEQLVKLNERIRFFCLISISVRDKNIKRFLWLTMYLTLLIIL